MKKHEPGTASFGGFARILGERSPSYVTQLKDDDRLVLTEDGKRIRVTESIERIRATANPAKAGVVAHHASEREARAAAPMSMAGAGHPPQSQDDSESDPEAVPETPDGFQYWRKRNEKAKALASERDNSVAEGKLLDASDVTTVVSAAITTLRARFESMPDVLGPQLAAITDEIEARAVLAEAIEHALDETARQFSTLSRAAQ